jgi:hypothetical protein
MADDNTNLPATFGQSGGSPFERIRRLDAYGREYWLAREVQPLMDYSRWEDVAAVVEKAKASLALVQGDDQANHHFATCRSDGGRWGNRKLDDYKLTRFGAYLTAMAGDGAKEAIAHARVYFATKTREAEVRALAEADVKRTALARAREMVDYKIFRDMMRDNAADYEPSSRETRIFFGAMQNALYRQITGMTADQIKTARELQTWTGRGDGKPEPGPKSKDRQIAKNYLTETELRKLERMVGRLCLRAEDIAEDGERLTMDEWRGLVHAELTVTSRRALAA